MTKPTKQQNGSYGFIAADVAASQKKALRDLMDTVCFCGEHFYGPAADGIAWVKAHRAEHHPDRVDRGQRARRRAAGIVRPGGAE